MPRRAIAWICVVMLAGLAQLTCKAADVNGWQSFTWGMTGEQIAAAGGQRVPRWHPPDKSFYVDFAQQLTLEGKPYVARLVMDVATDKLKAVEIQDTAPVESYTRPDRAQFDRLEALLTQRYGPASLRTDLNKPNDLFPSAKWSRTWALPGTSIELKHDWMDISGKPMGSFMIRYFPTKGSDASKL